MFANLVGKRKIIRFKVITEEAFKKLTSVFHDIVSEMKNDFPNDLVECLFEIRLGNEAYSGPNYEEFKKHYETSYAADHLKLVAQVTPAKQPTSPAISRIDLELDRQTESSFYVVGQNNNWVKGVFSRFTDIIEKIPTRNVVLHNVLFEMAVQLFAILILTIFAIFAANRIRNIVTIEDGAVYAFVVVFLLLSNLWTYIARGLIALRNSYYPIVDIRRSPRKPVLLAVASFIALAASGWAIKYVLDLLFIQK